MPISEIKEKFGIAPELIEMIGKNKAKIPLSFIDKHNLNRIVLKKLN